MVCWCVDDIKERVRFLGSVIVDNDGGKICIGGGSGFWRGTDTEWGVRKDMLRSDNEEFDVGCRFRDEDDGFKMAIGFVIGIHWISRWVRRASV